MAENKERIPAGVIVVGILIATAFAVFAAGQSSGVAITLASVGELDHLGHQPDPSDGLNRILTRKTGQNAGSTCEPFRDRMSLVASQPMPY